MSELFKGLNPAQRQAVETIAGPVLVLAGPGSGKTRVLTHRIAYLIKVVGVDPYNILAVTFTNKAAREMKERLEALIGHGAAQALTVGTFHSLCARFLRRDIAHLGRERDFAIYDSDDQERLMRRVLRDLNLDEKQNPPRAIHARISSAKNELVSPAEYARLNRTYFDEIVARCYERYQALLREANALDFDDLLVETVRLFEQHPEVLAKYHERYAYLLVDEYQDTNRAQYILVKQLATKRRNLFVVGDDDQSVYGWRGADIRNIRQFEQDYPDAQVILLEQNYRSTQSILDTAQAVINAGDKRKHVKKLWTENGEGLQVSLHEGYDQDEEAGFVGDEIGRLVASGDFSLRDCAIMYRTNAQSRAVEDTLRRRGLRYQLVGGIRFYERKEVKDVLAYLRVVHNPYDSVALLRVLNWPARGIGERTEAELTRWAVELGVPIYQALKEIDAPDAKTPFNPRTLGALQGFLRLLDELTAARRELPVLELLDRIVERVNVREALLREYGPDEADDRWANVQEIYNAAADFVNFPLAEQLPAYLEQVALVADVDKLDPDADAITCITLHQAKGLEYPAVFLIGLEEGLLPHSRSTDERDKLEEERRLLYVGMTRAKARLYLCYAFKRTSFGRTNVSTPSRFLADIPRELVKQPARRGAAVVSPQSGMFGGASFGGGYGGGRPTARGPSPARGAAGTWGGIRSGRPEGPKEVTYFAGQRVRHDKFGEGVVVSSRLVEGDEEVTISFADRERRILASFAKLERLG
ncbi:MAG TPA: UvrD-helicase domain-containing protein [Chloroflexaceae bacterium]|nr:UvrD-helicase domain-containing protein [Chloroflexaceae bacterium]